MAPDRHFLQRGAIETRLPGGIFIGIFSFFYGFRLAFNISKKWWRSPLHSIALIVISALLLKQTQPDWEDVVILSSFIEFIFLLAAGSGLMAILSWIFWIFDTKNVNFDLLGMTRQDLYERDRLETNIVFCRGMDTFLERVRVLMPERLRPRKSAIQKSLDALNALKAEVDEEMFVNDEIWERAKTLVYLKDKTEAFVEREGGDPEHLALLLVSNIAGEMIRSGRYHIYRGILGMQGTQIKHLFLKTISTMNEKGYSTLDETEKDRKWIEDTTRDSG